MRGLAWASGWGRAGWGGCRGERFARRGGKSGPRCDRRDRRGEGQPAGGFARGSSGGSIVRQATTYSCGAAALASILRYFLVWSGAEAELYQPLGTTPADGTLPEKLGEVAQTFGLVATVEQPMTIAALRGALRAGKLVILEFQAWPSPGAPAVPWTSRWDDGHFAVLIAMDRDYAYFMDPSTGDAYTYIPLAELVDRWHDINEVRKDPKLQRDYQLGVVIGKPATAPPVAGPRPPVAPSSRPRRLRRLE